MELRMDLKTRLVQITTAKIVDREFRAWFPITSAGQSQNRAWQSCKTELVMVGKMQGMMNGYVMELDVKTSLSITLVAFNNPNIIVHQESKQEIY